MNIFAKLLSSTVPADAAPAPDPMSRVEAAHADLASAERARADAERAVSQAAAARTRVTTAIAEAAAAERALVAAEAAAAAESRRWAESGGAGEVAPAVFAAAAKARDDAHRARLLADGAQAGLPAREQALEQAGLNRDLARAAVREARGAVLIAQAEADLDELEAVGITYREKLRSITALAVLMSPKWGTAHEYRARISPGPAAKAFTERCAALAIETPPPVVLRTEIDTWLRDAAALAERTE